MARTRIKLTPARVAKAIKAKKAETLWDDVVHGFGFRTTAKGAGAYFVDYYDVAGKRRRHTFARYDCKPTDAKLAAHRREAGRLKDAAKEGNDPARRREQLRDEPTLGDLWERFRDEHLADKAENTVKGYTGHFERNILPFFGEDTPVSTVTRQDFRDLHRSMTARGAATQADRTIATASSAFTFAAEVGWWPEDKVQPARVTMNRPPVQKRALTRPELAVMGKRLRADDTNAARMIELALLTGARLGEIRLMEWARLDLDRRVMELEDTGEGRGKTGARFIYLGAAAVEALERLPRVGRYVFPSPRNREGYPDEYGAAPYCGTGYESAWGRVATEDTTFEDVTAYMATRHTFLTFGEALRIDPRRLRMLSGHAPASGDAHVGYMDAGHPDLIAGLLEEADVLSGFLSLALEGRAPAPRDYLDGKTAEPLGADAAKVLTFAS